MRYVFDDCTLDTERYELRRASVRIPLRPKVFQLLTYLITHRDRVVLKDELVAHLWPKQFVGDAALKSCIMTARKAVGDAGRSQRIIQTLHGYGYRFVAAISTGEQMALARVAGPTPSRASVPPTPDSTVAPDPMAVPLLATPAPYGPEHKPVTVVCGRLAYAPVLASCLDSEVMHTLVQEVFAIVQATVQHYEGTLTHYASEGFKALFGAPIAHEDHARRAVLSALELQQRLSAYRSAPSLPPDVVLNTCLGVHTGPVVVGPLAGDTQQLYTAVGATTSLATRLQHLAAPDTIVCSDATYQLVCHEVQSEVVGSLAVSESTTPV